MKSQPPFREGRIHVMKTMCATCIYRPGNLMHLSVGRVEELTAAAVKADSCVVCHDTYGKAQAVCRGFFALHKTGPLQIAERMGLITEMEKQ